MKSTQSLKNKIKAVISATLIYSPHRVFAAVDGFQKVNEGINWWVVGLGSLSVATITGCVMWIGYKVLFDGKQLSQLKDVMIGGGLIGGAAGVGAWYAL